MASAESSDGLPAEHMYIANCGTVPAIETRQGICPGAWYVLLGQRRRSMQARLLGLRLRLPLSDD